MIPAFGLEDRRYLPSDPFAHKAVLGLVLLEQLGIGVQSAAHSTAITRKGLVVGNYFISPFAQNGNRTGTGTKPFTLPAALYPEASGLAKLAFLAACALANATCLAVQVPVIIPFKLSMPVSLAYLNTFIIHQLTFWYQSSQCSSSFCSHESSLIK